MFILKLCMGCRIQLVNQNKLGALQEVHLQFYDSSKVSIILAIKYSDLNQTKMSKRYLDISFLYVCMVNTIYLLSFVETPRKFIIAIINLRGVSTKLNKYVI